MLHSKNVQDAAISGRRLGVIVHQCEPLHLAIGGGQSIYNRSKELPMPTRAKFTALVPVLPQLGLRPTRRELPKLTLCWPRPAIMFRS